MPWLAVPIASPRTDQSRILSQSSISGPSIAPTTPVRITMTAVSDGRPPSRSVIPMATGAVTDFGASDTIETACAPSSHAIATALSADAIEPQTRLTRIATADLRTRSNWR